MSVLVIVPTFNERENIGSLIDLIRALPEAPDVLVVDDSSPDGTAEIIRAKQKEYGSDAVRLIVRTGGKGGRGAACVCGFRYACDNGYTTALEMDGDHSHDPADIPRLLERLDGADVVIGSKYLPESNIVGWNRRRTLLSFWANRYARMILRVPISDYTNGFRCYGPRALVLLPTMRIDGTGFTVIPQMTYQLYKAGMRIAEVPVVFTNRTKGVSNMRMKEIVESFFGILRIRL